MFKKIFALTVGFLSIFVITPAYAADIVVLPPAGQPAGAHEIWANGEIGQSFVTPAADVKAGFYVEYSPESAALMPPNAPITQIVASMYEGEGINEAKLLYRTSMTVNTTTQNFMDVDYANAGIHLAPGNTYTLGITSPYNRGWIVPSVCDYQNVDVSGQPTGAYTDGHPFFNGQIVLNETGICDNAFHVIDIAGSGTTAPVASPSPSATPAPSTVVKSEKKVELKGPITAVAANSIVINSTTVRLTSNTEIKLNYNKSFVVGMMVEGKGVKNTDGSVTATVIEVK